MKPYLLLLPLALLSVGRREEKAHDAQDVIDDISAPRDLPAALNQAAVSPRPRKPETHELEAYSQIQANRIHIHSEAKRDAEAMPEVDDKKAIDEALTAYRVSLQERKAKDPPNSCRRLDFLPPYATSDNNVVWKWREKCVCWEMRAIVRADEVRKTCFPPFGFPPPNEVACRFASQGPRDCCWDLLKIYRDGKGKFSESCKYYWPKKDGKKMLPPLPKHASRKEKRDLDEALGIPLIINEANTDEAVDLSGSPEFSDKVTLDQPGEDVPQPLAIGPSDANNTATAPADNNTLTAVAHSPVVPARFCPRLKPLPYEAIQNNDTEAISRWFINCRCYEHRAVRARQTINRICKVFDFDQERKPECKYATNPVTKCCEGLYYSTGSLQRGVLDETCRFFWDKPVPSWID